MEINSSRRRWLLWAIVVSAIAVFTTYFAAIMYWKGSNSLNSIDSELCMWLAMGQEACESFPDCGLLRLNFSRGILQWILSVCFAGVVGVSVWKAIAVIALYNALSIVGMASLLSIKRDDDDGKINFCTIQFIALTLLQAAFYFVNVGHEVSYVLTVCGLFAVNWKFKREWKRHALIVLITALGVVNDDMFLLCFAMPLLILNILRYLVGKWYDKISFSVVTGIAIGGALLKVLVECDVVWYLTSPLKLVRAQDLGSWFNDMFLSYLFMFRVSSVMGRELKSLEIIKFAAVFSTMLFSAGAVLVAGYRAIASRFSKSDERSAYIVLMFLAITMSYLFLDSSTKPLGHPIPRYVYFSTMALLYLLADVGFDKKMPARCKTILFAICLLAFSFAVRDDLVRKSSNAGNRENLNCLVTELKASGIKHAYSDYWTFWSLIAASKGSILASGLGYSKKIDKLSYHTIGFVDASYDKECHAYVMPLRKRHKGSFDPDENRRVAIRTFGEPDRTVQIGGDYEVMYFEKNIALGRPRLPAKKR